MEVIEYEQDKVIAAQNDKVTNWYLIRQGSVIQKTKLSEIRLEKNSIIGFLERDVYLCDYIAAENTTLVAFQFENSEDIKKMINGQEKLRGIFLRAAVLQRHQLLCLYSELSNKQSQFRNTVLTLFNDYKTFCASYRIPEQSFRKMEQFKPLTITHKAEKWEINNSVSIVKNYIQEYLQLMGKDDALTVGVIMEAAAQMRRFTQGIFEMESYLSYNREILIGDSSSDIFKLFFDLTVEMRAKKFPLEPVEEKLNLIVETAKKLQLYSERMLERRMEEFTHYEMMAQTDEESGEEKAGGSKNIDFTKINCTRHILTYAEYSGEEIDEISAMIEKYFNLPDILSTDHDVYALRRKIADVFYEIYYRVFIRAVKDESTLNPILKMFLNFGFMDAALVSEEKLKALDDLCAHLDICHSRHVFTIYEWLKCIYKGTKETSKNEFDQNYAAYLTEQCKMGEMTKEQADADVKNPEKRVQFEIESMFKPVNKLVYGKVTTFCPILNDSDLINTIDKMLVTADRLDEVINEVRKVDFSLFYREVAYSDPAKGINTERVMKEVLPDIVLMPNAGTRAMMWQETANVKSDSAARYMFPIFTSVDLSDLMMETFGRYRWEMCRKVEGIYWNDIREKSLTAEYCAYLQFYRKNNDLSADAKEKLKSALTRAKNNYREVFVRDYVNFVKFESKGSYRLNKIARDILVRYCPFAKAVRNELRANPFYQNSITRFETEANKKLQRYQGVYLKYEKAGGEKGEDLKATIRYYQM